MGVAADRADGAAAGDGRSRALAAPRLNYIGGDRVRDRHAQAVRVNRAAPSMQPVQEVHEGPDAAVTADTGIAKQYPQHRAEHPRMRGYVKHVIDARPTVQTEGLVTPQPAVEPETADVMSRQPSEMRHASYHARRALGGDRPAHDAAATPGRESPEPEADKVQAVKVPRLERRRTPARPRQPKEAWMERLSRQDVDATGVLPSPGHAAETKHQLGDVRPFRTAMASDLAPHVEVTSTERHVAYPSVVVSAPPPARTDRTEAVRARRRGVYRQPQREVSPKRRAGGSEGKQANGVDVVERKPYLRTDKFLVGGVTLNLTNIKPQDELTHRIEALRMYLAEQLGDTQLLALYRAAESCGDLSVTGVFNNQELSASLMAHLPPARCSKLLPLILQLLHCENKAFSNNGTDQEDAIVAAATPTPAAVVASGSGGHVGGA